MQGLGTSIMGRALESGIISLSAVNIRDFSQDKHKKVDDYTYGGGAGMLMQAQPVYDAWKSVSGNKKLRTVYLTPQGIPFSQKVAADLAKEEEVVFLCGHYEGIDERVLEEVVTDYVSIGDYVLTGGELPAMVMIDAISRLVPGVLNNEESAETESFHCDLLEYPQYSRPEVWHDKKVPDVLLSGDHKKIKEWRLEKSIERTKERRPDLLAKYDKQQSCISLLMKDKLSHMDMIEVLRRGKADILYFAKDGVLLQDRESGYFMATALSEKGAIKIADMLESKTLDCRYIISHQELLNDLICERFGYHVLMQCRNSVYTRKEVLPLKKSVTEQYKFLVLKEKDLPLVEETYSYVDMDYLKDRMNKNCLFGLYEEDKLLGYIGIHADGSLGMLEVFPEYQRKGLGAILETYLINHTLKMAWIPFGQVEMSNEASYKLQEKLGLCFSKNTLWWLEKNTCN